MALNFVKFQRGSQSAYENLKNANRLEDDALYFIYNKHQPEEGGLLYLGKTLIGGTGIIGAKQLNELEDINLDKLPSGYTSLSDGMILQYNVNTQKWEPSNIKQAIENSGARSYGNEKLTLIVKSVELENNQTIEEALDNANPHPLSGDITIVNNNPYIYDGENWILLLDEEKISIKIIDGNLPEINDEIKNKILLVPNNSGKLQNVYDKYIVVNDQYELLSPTVGQLDELLSKQEFQSIVSNSLVTKNEFNTKVNNLVNKTELQEIITNYITKDNFNAAVGDLNQLAGAVGKTNTNLSAEITELYERLQWQQIIE